MNAYVKYFDKDNKCINLLINDKKISEKSNEICNDYYSSLLKRKFYSDKVYTIFKIMQYQKTMNILHAYL